MLPFSLQMRDAGFDSVCAPRGSSMHAGGVRFDEYIVYDPDQALPRYIVHFGKYAHSVAHPRLALSTSFVRHEITPQRNFDPNDELQMHFRVHSPPRLCSQHSPLASCSWHSPPVSLAVSYSSPSASPIVR